MYTHLRSMIDRFQFGLLPVTDWDRPLALHCQRYLMQTELGCTNEEKKTHSIFAVRHLSLNNNVW